MKKRWIAGALVAACCFPLAGCSGNQAPPAKKLAPPEDLMEYGSYSLETWLKPFWYTREIYNETLMFVGENDQAALLYEADQILSVLSYGLDRAFSEGKDYVYENGVFRRTADSEIPFWEVDEYYRTQPDVHSIRVDKSQLSISLEGERFLKYGEKDTFTAKQIAVTYVHNEEWQGPVPADKSEKFAKTLAKLRAGKRVKLLFYGDSITTGCNASGTVQGGEVSPYTPSFPEMICEYLKKKYSCDIESVNTAVGGKNTAWGESELDARVIAHEPDLVFLGFGMNDPKLSAEVYKNTVRRMIERIHEGLPDAEILLVAPMLPNNEADAAWNGNQKVFASALLELETDYDFAGVANVTEMHRALLEAGKRYRDMTGNNINHPNDFVVRLYAQVLLKTLLGSDFCREIYS